MIQPLSELLPGSSSPTGRYVQRPARRGVARGLWRVVVLVLLDRATLERAHSRTTQSHLRATAHTAQAAPMTSSSATYQAPAPAPPAAAQQLPPLASAVLVVGQDTEGQSTVPSEIAALPHVAELVSEFLDCGTPQLWSISRACECNFMTLLPRLATREALAVGAVDDYKKAFEAGKGLVFAVKYDSMVMVQWLHAYCPKAFTRKAMEVAASAGKLHMLQWIVANFENVAISPIFAELAAESGHVDAFEWLWTHPKSSSATLSERSVIQTMEYAATNGHLSVVKWLSEHEEKKICSGASPFSNALAKAIHYGHLDVAKYLFNLDAFSQGITSEAYLRDLVVGNRDAATVQWLRGLSQQTQQQSRVIAVGQ